MILVIPEFKYVMTGFDTYVDVGKVEKN